MREDRARVVMNVPAAKHGAVLNDASAKMAERMHAVFYLRTIGGNDAIVQLSECLLNRSGSELLRHEVAFVLGQMGDESANATLTAILQDVDDDVMVRHEAAEALGAIGSMSSIEALVRFLDDASIEVSQTCKLALERIKWKRDSGSDGSNGAGSGKSDKYKCTDPAPAVDIYSSVTDLEAVLLDTSHPLFDRYGALFALREWGGADCANALARGLVEDDSSALFRHEVAYVLGQMHEPCTLNALAESLSRVGESKMVRHEAAEALGAIGTSEAIGFLKKFSSDACAVVRESCLVALDAAEYWNDETDVAEEDR